MDSDRLDHPLSDGVITLRPPTPADRTALLSMRDDEFRRFLGEGSPEPAPTACVVDGSGSVVGWIDHDNDRTWLRSGEVNVGYAIGPEHRGKGYATRALRLLASHLAAHRAPRMATLLIDPANVASVAVAERAGFVEVGAVDGERFFVRRAVASPFELVPVIAVRLAEGRCGSTVLMSVLASGAGIVFDDRYPSEYRFLSYFARMADQMTQRFEPDRHPGVTPFFFGPERTWGPIPFTSDVVDVETLARPLLHAMWQAWTERMRAEHPTIRAYAEKTATPIGPIAAAGIPLRVIDLVRDPRDILASIRAFTARGVDGFGRTDDVDETTYIEQFAARFAAGIDEMNAPLPAPVERITVRYEDLVSDPRAEVARLSSWLEIDLDPSVVDRTRSAMRQHVTSPSTAESIGRWRRDLSTDDAATLARLLGDRVSQFGYDL